MEEKNLAHLHGHGIEGFHGGIICPEREWHRELLVGRWGGQMITDLT